MTQRRKCARCLATLSPKRHSARKKYCFSCEVAVKKEQKARAHDRRVTMNGFTGADYWALYEAQGGTCAVYGCRANGRTKYLAVEHDHSCTAGHDPKQWCRVCTRGLACSRHNSWLGNAKDDPLVFDSLAAYLRDPPARKVLNERLSSVNSWYHAVSASHKWGGTPEQYIDIEEFIDGSKRSIGDVRHRSLYHHTEGVWLCQRIFGRTIAIGHKQIPVRLVAERHVLEDLGWLPSPADYISGMPLKPWMGGKQRKTVDLSTLNLTGVTA